MQNQGQQAAGASNALALPGALCLSVFYIKGPRSFSGHCVFDCAIVCFMCIKGLLLIPGNQHMHHSKSIIGKLLASSVLVSN